MQFPGNHLFQGTTFFLVISRMLFFDELHPISTFDKSEIVVPAMSLIFDINPRRHVGKRNSRVNQCLFSGVEMWNTFNAVKILQLVRTSHYA